MTVDQSTGLHGIEPASCPFHPGIDFDHRLRLAARHVIDQQERRLATDDFEQHGAGRDHPLRCRLYLRDHARGFQDVPTGQHEE